MGGGIQVDNSLCREEEQEHMPPSLSRSKCDSILQSLSDIKEKGWPLVFTGEEIKATPNTLKILTDKSIVGMRQFGGTAVYMVKSECALKRMSEALYNLSKDVNKELGGKLAKDDDAMKVKLAEKESELAHLEQEIEELRQSGLDEGTSGELMELLHEYNDIKDTALVLFGKLGEAEGKAVYSPKLLQECISVAHNWSPCLKLQHHRLKKHAEFGTSLQTFSAHGSKKSWRNF
eukprot:Nk52_evm104s485 gene=Nk52_evmTU104s485